MPAEAASNIPRLLSRAQLDQSLGLLRIHWHHRRYFQLLLTFISIAESAIEWNKFDALLDVLPLARASADSVGRSDLVLFVQHTEAVVLQRTGELDAALEVATSVATAAATIGDVFRQAQACAVMGQVLREQSENETALQELRTALRLYRSTANIRSEAQTLGDIANTYDGLDLWDSARSNYEQALALFWNLDDRSSLARVHWDLAISSWRAGNRELASTHRAFNLTCLLSARLPAQWLKSGFDWIAATSFQRTHEQIAIRAVTSVYDAPPDLVETAIKQNAYERSWKQIGELLHPQATDPFRNIAQIARLHRDTQTRSLLTLLQNASHDGMQGELPYMISDLRHIGRLAVEQGRDEARAYIRDLRPRIDRQMRGLPSRYRTRIRALAETTPNSELRALVNELNDPDTRRSNATDTVLVAACRTVLESSRQANSDAPSWAVDTLGAATRRIGRTNGVVFLAEAHRDLGSAFRNRATGDQGGNCERAIAHLRYALQLLTPANSSNFFARMTTINALANAYLYRLRGDRLKNLRTARDHLRVVTSEVTSTDSDALYAVAMQNLALVHHNLSEHTGPADQELSISLYQTALAFLDDAQRSYKLSALMNLADAYRKRIAGDPTQNVELGVQYASQAHKISLEVGASELISQTAASLASLHASRSIGDSHTNVQHALDLYELALAHTDDANLHGRAVIHGNIGNAYQADVESDRQTVLLLARDSIRRSADLWTRVGDSAELGRSLHNLANCHFNMWHEANLESDLTEAAQLFRGAIETRANAGDGRGVLESKLGYAEVLLERREESDSSDAVAQLWDVVNDESQTGEDLRASAAAILGRHQANAGQWPDAVQTLELALKIREHIYGQAMIGLSKQNALTGVSEVAQLLGLCLARCGQDLRAIEVIELYRARLLIEAHRIAALEPSRSGDHALGPQLQYEPADAQANLRAAGSLQHNFTDLDIDSPSRVQSPFHLWGVAEESIAAMEPLVDLDEDQVLQYNRLNSDEMVIYLVTTQQGSLIASVTNDGVKCETSDFSLQTLRELLFGSRPSDLGYLDAWMAYDQVVFEPRLDAVCRTVGDWLSGSSLLSSSHQRRVSLVPCGVLASLPINGALVDTPEGVTSLFGTRTISVIPSLRFAFARGAMSDSSWNRRFVAFVNPDETLPLSEEEVGFPLEDSDAVVFSRDQATCETATREIESASTIHFGCHGRFDADQPAESYLQMADGRLTVSEVHDHVTASVELAFVAACESAVSDVAGLPDELLGMPLALLRAGARYVVGTQWPVGDLTVAVFSTMFYKRLTQEEAAVPDAFHDAVQTIAHSTTSELLDEIPEQSNSIKDALRIFGDAERPFSGVLMWSNFVLIGH